MNVELLKAAIQNSKVMPFYRIPVDSIFVTHSMVGTPMRMLKCDSVWYKRVNEQPDDDYPLQQIQEHRTKYLVKLE